MDHVAGPRLRNAGLQFSDDPAELKAVESDIFGFWIFLMSDAVLFALLFAIYGSSLGATAGAPGPAQEFKLGAAFIETLLLLTSSFAFGLASIALTGCGKTGGRGKAPSSRPIQFFRSLLKHGSRRLIPWMIATLILGLAFLGMEAHDFATMAADHAVPARSGYLSAFFILVGMHGLHVTIGAIWMVVMMVQIAVLGIDRKVKVNLIRLSLFWHFLDVIWIAIFSVVYLQGLIR